MTDYQCAECGTPTTRGTLLLTDGHWIAVPLCSVHKNAVADVQPKGTLIVDATRQN